MHGILYTDSAYRKYLNGIEFRNLKRQVMKKLKMLILVAGVLAGTLFMEQAKAQINISINIGSQPEWGPTGYNHVDYYYLPDINAYYDVSTAQYIYLQGHKWRFVNRLPNRYRHYDIYNSYKVVVNRPHPYNNYQIDQSKYAAYRGRKSQPILRDHGYAGNYNQVARKATVVRPRVTKPVTKAPVRRATVTPVRNNSRVTTQRTSVPRRAATATRKVNQRGARR